MNGCFICPTTSVELCPSCEIVRYCNEHGNYHRETEACFPYIVSHREGVGRLLLASRDIFPGEVIFKEEALVTGPGKTTSPVCLGCLVQVDCTVWCDGCHWPLCSTQCHKITNHTKEECQLIAEWGDSINQEMQQGAEAHLRAEEVKLRAENAQIRAEEVEPTAEEVQLRAVVEPGAEEAQQRAEEAEPRAEKVQPRAKEIESKTEEFKLRGERVQLGADEIHESVDMPQPRTGVLHPRGEKTQLHTTIHTLYRSIKVLRALLLPPNQLKFMIQFMGHQTDCLCPGHLHHESGERPVACLVYQWGKGRWTMDQVSRVEAIMDTNVMGRNAYSVDENRSGDCFLPITSLISHCCIPNTIKIGDGPLVTTRAKVAIREGEEITGHYHGLLKGREWRQRGLQRNWHFTCCCNRCGSPGELGAEMSTLRCWRKCCWSNVRPVLSSSACTGYQCEECGDKYSLEDVLQIENDLAEQLGHFQCTDTSGLKEVVTRAEKTFHPRHWLVLRIKVQVVNTLGRQDGHLYHQLREEDLDIKIKYCKDYLDALQVIDPGISWNRGIILWELYTATAFSLNKKFKELRVAPVKFIDGLEESLGILTEVMHCLQFYPEHSQEARTKAMASLAQQKIQETIKLFKEMIPSTVTKSV